MSTEPELIQSPLSQAITRDGHTLEVDIYCCGSIVGSGRPAACVDQGLEPFDHGGILHGVFTPA